MSNVFWAVFYGSVLGTLTVTIAAGLFEEWQHRQHHKRLGELGEFLEDLEYDDDEEK
jgi:hypothetical protein